MKIFISWSKQSSNQVAICLKEFIEEIFDGEAGIEFFISSEDIYSGENWFNTVSNELSASQLAIICLTNENRFSKWLDFESGALAFNDKNATVCPFLFDIEKLEEGNPLTHFQVTKNSKKDLLKLVKTIGKKSTTTLTEKQIEKIFSECYNSLDKKLNEIKKVSSTTVESIYFDKYIYPTDISGTENNKLFLGTPMASINGEQYLKNRTEVMKVIGTIKKYCHINNIYSPVVDNPKPEEFEGQERAMEMDFAKLKQSEYYVFIYPEKVASSILVEIGYAIALLKKTIIFVRSRKDLPFMLEKADKRNKHIKIYEYANFTDLKKLIKTEGEVMFKFN